MELLRKPAVAGMFYPASAGELRQQISGFLAKTQKINIPGEIKALIVPHAGFEYSGLTAAWGYKQIQHKKHFVLIGPSHRFRFTNLVADAHTEWETPLGKIRHIVPKASDIIGVSEEPHQEEHCLEVQVPWLQVLCPSCQVTGLLTSGEVDTEKAANYLLKQYPDSPIIISTDLSHYLPMQQAGMKDMQTVIAMEKLEDEYFERFTNVACGSTGVRIALAMAKQSGWRIQAIHYETSASASGETGRVVGYLSAALYEISK